MGTTQRRTAARVVEDYVQRVYDRSGARGILLVGFGAITTAVLAVTWVVTTFYAGYNGETVGRMIPFAAGTCAAAGMGLALGLLASRRVLLALLGWADRSPSPSGAADVWAAALDAPRVLALRGTIAVFGTLELNMLNLYRGLDLPWSAYPMNAVSVALQVATGGVAVMLFLEYLLRPLTADVARWLPADFELETPRLALPTKAILPIPGVVLYTAFIVGGLIDTSAAFEVQVVQEVLLSVAIGVLGVALYYVLAHAFLDPIDQLTAATQRVHAGDLDTRVPVVSGDEFGGLAVSFNRMLDGLQERERLRTHNAELGDALEQSLAEVQASRARIVEAADDERRRMERDLHDGAQQRLVMISLKLGMAAELLHDHPEGIALVEELRTDAARAVDELRDLAHGIYPPLLESDGLTSALEDIADQAQIPIHIEGDGAGRYPAPVEAAVYFCCLEALQNAAKYAGSESRATVRLGEDEGVLRFSVADDGRGFDTSGANGTAGLQNMKDRIGALGGSVEVISAPGAGTRVEGTVPV